MAKLLLIEDDKDTAESVKDWLVGEKHIVEIIDNGAQALDCLRFFAYDLIILDLQIPGLDGLRSADSFGLWVARRPS